MKKGFSYIVVLITVFMMGGYLSLLFSNTNNSLKSTQKRILSSQARSLAQAGVAFATHELSYNGDYAGVSDYQLDNTDGTIDISVTKTSDTTRRIVSQSYLPNKTSPRSSKKIQVDVEGSNNVSGNTFNFAIQAGSGGFYSAENKNPSIEGSIYSNENVQILGSGASVSNDIYAVGSIVMNGNTGGGQFPNSPEQPLPTVDIDYWKQKASEGLVWNGDLPISANGVVRLGGENEISVINGRLLISSNAPIFLYGPVWIKGIGGSSIEISGNPKFFISQDYAENQTAIIADQKITISGNATFDSEKTNAWLLLLSDYPGTLSPDTSAIEINSNVKFTSTIVYAYNGKLWFRSNTSGVSAKTFVGQKILIDSNLSIKYDQGLATISFNNPNQQSGGFSLVPGSYTEIDI